MKKLFVTSITFLLCVSFLSAQNNRQNRRSDRKIIEIQKIVTLTPEQESVIRSAHDEYNRRNDSILFKVSDGAAATALKRQSDRNFEQRLLNIFTEEQREQYLSVRATPRTGERSNEQTQRQRSNRKMIELNKLIDNITPEQESIIRTAHDEQNRRNDSILFQVSDGAQATALKRESDRTFNQQLLDALTEEQRAQYLGNTATPRTERQIEQTQRQRSNRKMIELRKVIEHITPEQESIIRRAHDEQNRRNDSILFQVSDGVQATALKRESDRTFNQQLLSALTDAQREQYLSITSTARTTERRSEQQRRQRSDNRIVELKKIIDIAPEQEEIIREALLRHREMGDSLLLKVADAAVVAELGYQSSRELHETLMNTLTEEQRNHYFRVSTTPEVWAKAAAKVDELREAGDYTPAMLEEAQTQIFEYLMLEKIVYARDKYDFRKQRDNIRLLKKLEPRHLKKANEREKLRTQGSSVQGRVRW